MGMTNDTIELLANVKTHRLDDTLMTRAWTVSDPGIAAYDLEQMIHTLNEVKPITPLRDMMPRVKSNNGDTSARWTAISANNSAKVAVGVQEGKRGGLVDVNKGEYSVAYKTLGLENSITSESILAAGGRVNAEALMVQNLILAYFLEEENAFFGGNNSVALGTGSTPTIADVTTGGAIGQTITVYVRIVPLTHEGYRYTKGSVTALPGEITRTNADATTSTYGGYNGQVSTASNLTTATDGLSTHSVTAYWTNITGAAAYAVYWGPDGTTNCVQGAITTINSIVITTAAGTGQASNASALSSDYSKNTYVFDGITSIIAGDGPLSGASGPVGGVYATQATGTVGTGVSLTADTAGGIVEFNTDFRTFWDNYNISPTHIFMNAQEALDVNMKIIAGGGAPIIRLNVDANAMTSGSANIIGAGMSVKSILNPITSTMVQLVIHASCPPGMIVYYTQRSSTIILPDVVNLMQFKTRQDYYQVNWPQVTRTAYTGVYTDGMLQCYYPAAFGIRRNIGTS